VFVGPAAPFSLIRCHWEVDGVRQVTNVGLWLVTIGRVLAAFGLGVLAAWRYPALAGRLGLPTAIAGIACLLVAGWLQRRAASRSADSPPAP